MKILRELPDGRFVSYGLQMSVGPTEFHPISTPRRWGSVDDVTVAYFYTSNDCTGTPYMYGAAETVIRVPSAYAGDWRGKRFISEGVLHYPSATPETVTLRSGRSWDQTAYPYSGPGVCTDWGAGFSGERYPMETLDLLGGFTPPFRLE